MFKVNNKDTRTTSGINLVSLLLTLSILHTFSSVSLVNFEPVDNELEVPKSFVNFFSGRDSEYFPWPGYSRT